jgi:thiamine-phosphate pyrophosphorylase
MRPSLDLSLYLVVGRGDCRRYGLVETVEAAVKGGVSCVQLREKSAMAEEIAGLARALKEKLDPAGVPLILNDEVDLALSVDAAGVHLGQDDMDHRAARARLGSEKILGLSVGTPEEGEGVDPAALDYIGVGPFAETGSKSDAGAAIGAEGLKAVTALFGLPAVAIGGISQANAAAALSGGVQGLAVVSAIAGAEDPEAAARQLREIVDSHGSG